MACATAGLTSQARQRVLGSGLLAWIGRLGPAASQAVHTCSSHGVAAPFHPRLRCPLRHVWRPTSSAMQCKTVSTAKMRLAVMPWPDSALVGAWWLHDGARTCHALLCTFINTECIAFVLACLAKLT